MLFDAITRALHACMPSNSVLAGTLWRVRGGALLPLPA